MVDVYADEGITGRSMARRESLKRLIHDAEKGLFDVVLIKALSRLSRDTPDSINIVRTLHSHKVEVFSSREGMIDDELILSVISAVNQRQSEDTSYNISWGIAVKSKEGIFHGTPPIGYDKVKPGKLVPSVVHAPTVQLIFDLYLNIGMGVQAIANHLNDELGVLPSRKNSKKWHDSSIRLILTNRHYTGDLVQGRSKVDSKDKKFLQDNGYKKRHKIDESEWIVVPNHHEPLVTREQFEAVQEKMKQKAARMFRGRGRKSLFARVAFCVDCGAGMNFRNDRKSYVCATYQKNTSKKCSSHIIKHDALKQVVLSHLKDLLENSLNMKSLVDVTIQRAGIKKNNAVKELEKLQREISKLDKELVQLTRKWTSGDIDTDMFNACSVAVKNERQALEERAARLQTEIAHEHDTESRVSAFKAELMKFASLDVSNEEILRDMIHKMINCVDVHEDGSIEISYNFQNPLKQEA
ncbi:recombinase family protein [Paenibacillus chitinolyticus]|uniref:Recombinase family protein n=1 Tax=Paenibacillus chitinolyticus TaxID=79263 RepID=A0A410WZC2_9BACL|nr:recombinase family protein [Paenibacillus chitinolyticus]MCY9590325.1 recombinase family protein [Paenibacillus chitinolyticus]MCY9597021.1 recombinase family protein [Paenibacillus chitinolyticus]QAV19683.1 recombinase family protein [Paenibacillus chitinolyticus]